MGALGPALVGGAMIGLAATLLLWFNGRIAGVSGIAAGLLPPRAGDLLWRLAFVAGLLLGPVGVFALTGRFLVGAPAVSTPTLIVAGLLVGVGTVIGGGCTSGHGVCGLARLSRRSLAATLTFMIVAAATVFVTRHVL